MVITHPSILRRLQFTALSAALAIGACAPVYYAPGYQPVPLLVHKNDHYLAATINGTDYTQGFTFCGAWSPANHVGVIAEGSRFANSESDDQYNGKGHAIQLGAGYNVPLARRMAFEAFGLTGWGAVKNTDLESPPNSMGLQPELRAKIFRYGIQSNIGWSSKIVDLALSLRAHHLNYFHIEGDLLYSGTPQNIYLRQYNQHWMIEPALTMGLGFRRLKYQMQIGFSRNLSHQDFTQEEVYFAAGIAYRFRTE